jgi:hypothetical protein
MPSGGAIHLPETINFGLPAMIQAKQQTQPGEWGQLGEDANRPPPQRIIMGRIHCSPQTHMPNCHCQGHLSLWKTVIKG